MDAEAIEVTLVISLGLVVFNFWWMLWVVKRITQWFNRRAFRIAAKRLNDCKPGAFMTRDWK